MFKRGRILLLSSSILGGLFFGFSAAHLNRMIPFLMFQIGPFRLNLPEITLPAHLLMVLFAVCVNVAAFILRSKTFAGIAAVFYGAAMGFAPLSYPYVIVEMILCLVAIARIELGNSSDAEIPDTASDHSVPIGRGGFVNFPTGASSSLHFGRSAGFENKGRVFLLISLLISAVYVVYLILGLKGIVKYPSQLLSFLPLLKTTLQIILLGLAIALNLLGFILHRRVIGLAAGIVYALIIATAPPAFVCTIFQAVLCIFAFVMMPD